MADLALTPSDAAEALGLPVEIGAATLSVPGWLPMTSIAPYRGRAAAVSAALEAKLGLGLPDAGRAIGSGAAEAIWMGRGQWFLAGPALTDIAAAVGAEAALTDQSDAWAVLELAGADARAVLARLCPLDLDPSVFPPGHTARSELAHMMASVTALAAGYRIMVMRSFAGTAVHDLTQAMRSVAAQRQL